jgi:SAM-dependent methyltransferase
MALTAHISRAEIEQTIKSYPRWYQDIHFGPLLATRSSLLNSLKHLLFGPYKKTKLVLENLDGLERKRVIDVGCNSGLYALEASCRGAVYVLGIDNNPVFIDQARKVAEIFRRQGRPVGNNEFKLVDTMQNHLDLLDDKDVMIACCVLYHLGPLHEFKERLVKSTIRRLILQGNVERRRLIGRENNPSSEYYEPVEKTWENVLCDIAGMTAFCESVGFKVERIAGPRYNYPLVIATR